MMSHTVLGGVSGIESGAYQARTQSLRPMQCVLMRLPLAKVMAYTYLVPTWVILWELALGHTVPPWTVLGGVGLTVLALGLLLKEE